MPQLRLFLYVNLLYLGSVSAVFVSSLSVLLTLMIRSVDIIKVGLHCRLGMAPSFV